MRIYEYDGIIQRIVFRILTAPELNEAVEISPLSLTKSQKQILKDAQEVLTKLENCENTLTIAELLTENSYSELGIYQFQKNDDPEMKIVGRQRVIIQKLLGKKSVPKFHPSIHWKDGVTITAKKVMNSLPVFSTDTYPNGVIDVDLDPERLQKGSSNITEIALHLDQGKSIQVEQILPYGILTYQFLSKAIYFPEDLEKRGVREEDLIHECGLRVIDPETKKISKWKCVYHLVEGKIISLEKVEADD